ncbi:MAG: class I SAM-dependent methyltransferase [Ferruginibacter sp.]
MELINGLAEKYAALFSSPEEQLVHNVSEYTKRTHGNAHMLSGHLQGIFLTIISTLLQPHRILEIGTFTGYSALCLAKGLQEGGLLHTIELREEDARTANGFFRQSVHTEKIILHTGNAKDIIPLLKESWDIVFIDADKTGYIDYYELILPAVKQNGLIIADNVLFHGQVLEENITGKNALAIHDFNLHVKKDARVEQLLLTLRDGLLIIRKL